MHLIEIKKLLAHSRQLFYIVLMFTSVSGCQTAAITGPVPRQVEIPPTSTPIPPPATPSTSPPITPPTAIRVMAVGDIMLGGTAAPELAVLGYDYPFALVGDVLRRGDIVFGNLEGPLTLRGQPARDKRYIFRSPPARVVPALKAAGFNVLSLANNHMLDYGVEGLEDSMSALTAAGIHFAGAGMNAAQARAPALIEVHGRRFAILAYSLTLPEEFYAAPTRPGTAFGHEAHVRSDVARARQAADAVIVSFHWGQEGTTALREYQQRIGRAAIDAGAQIVVGHHPHILQGVECYSGGVILHSLGNFVFGSYSKTARRSAIAEIVFANDATVHWQELRLLPLDVDNTVRNFQPQRLDGGEADAVVRHLQQLSRPLGCAVENQQGIARIVAAPR